jgi:hypothetical protein
VGEEEGTGGVIKLDTADGPTKLRENVGEEMRDGGESVRFEAQCKSP